MTTAELLQRIQQRLGEQTTLYTDEELLVNGLNPALRLVCLARPLLLRARATLTLSADVPWYDLRQISRQLVRIHRVVLGTITGDDLTVDTATGVSRDLTRISLAQLHASRSDWLRQQDTPEQYWTWAHWFGLFPRPRGASTLTLVYDAVEAELALAAPAGTPQLAAVWHPLVSELAASLALVKEGGIEGKRGLELLGKALGLAPAQAQQKGVDGTGRPA